MIRKTLIVLALATAFAAPAHAQFGKLKELAGGGSSSSSSSAAPSEADQEALVRRFAASQSHSLEAQTAFAKAFGLAEQVQLLEAERQALSSGSVNVDKIKKSVSVSDAAQAAIDERVAAKPELSAESKQHYTDGLIALAASAVEGQKLSGEASNFANGMKNLGATQLATVGRKLAAGAWVAKESPGYLKGLYSSSKAALTFARASKIKVPGNAESLLDTL
ncbi:hypothetical protein PDM28_02530 [Stenotrophomonas aracearum]|jgi:hypothetical protein|uniref:DUF4142 domain-containing protein n=1 Tax=Stenotrophomonas aracearum TaxID=3003272 RepID=A0ABY9YEC5_9GAMM|nr:hypothetical protein [Stenotrophomonas sp. A5588]WNH49228.1 hypothetical protein PDM28_02530 [Stenotrophomonas sp. A5588]